MQLLDGKQIAQKIQNEIKSDVNTLSTRPPCLKVILVGENPASKIYVNRKTKACSDVGFNSETIQLPSTVSEEDLLKEIHLLNIDPDVDGILVQAPLPDHIQASRINEAIDPHKDVDGFHPLNMGKLLMGDPDGFVACTPLGIMEMLKRSNIDLTGKRAVVMGRSNIVGKPMAALLAQNVTGANATVTLVHSRTQDSAEICRTADLIVVAIGKSNSLTADMVKDGAIVVDVGINRILDETRKRGYRVDGDVDFENVKEKCSWITPVPGGVGPMTIAMLLQNTFKSFLSRI